MHVVATKWFRRKEEVVRNKKIHEKNVAGNTMNCSLS